MPTTLTVNTPSGGKHYYFKLTGSPDEDKLKNWVSCMHIDGTLIAVDLRKAGGYVLIPPSQKGLKRYLWETKEEFKAEMADLPAWIITNILESQRKQKKHFEAQEFTCNPSANEDVTSEDIELFKQSPYWQDCFTCSPILDSFNRTIITATAPYDCAICQRRHENNSNHPFLVRHNNRLRFVCRPGAGFNREIEPDYNQVWNEFDPLFRDFILAADGSDRAVSELLKAMIGGHVLPGLGKEEWYMFDKDESRFRMEHRDVILQPYLDKAVDQFKELKRLATKFHVEEDDVWGSRAAFAGNVANSMSTWNKKNGQVASVFELIRDNRKDKLFNANTSVFACKNGVLDLATGEFRDARPDDYSTLYTPLVYLPYDEHPEWKKDLIQSFLEDIMLGDTDLIMYLLKAISSALDGKTKDQQVYFFYGKGANGKSALVRLLEKVFGEYYTKVSSAMVGKPNFSSQGATSALMELIHKRAAFLTEMELNVLYTEFLKLVAGGDETTGRQLYQKQSKFRLCVKLFIALNNLPKVEDKTHGFWRKVVMIPFSALFIEKPDPQKPNERLLDESLEPRLMECADTFLALLVDVYHNLYKQDGVKKGVQPKIIQDLTEKYQHSQNIQLKFFTEYCVEEKNHKITSDEVLQVFRQYLKKEQIKENQNLVRDLYTFIDEKFPPSNKGRQFKKKVGDKWENFHGWTGFRISKNDPQASSLLEPYSNSDGEESPSDDEGEMEVDG
ncbi:hypothetical protein HDV00_000272 [Rhizophlyctis rosea]|nr:hypothetical protein HDV00_000272 [Rhizophlyctis rosea]